MHFMTPRAITFTAMISLAGCGGASLDELIENVDTSKNKPLLEVLQGTNQGLARTPSISDLPPGSGSYAGFAQLLEGADDVPGLAVETVGVAAFDLNFGTGAIIGAVTGFDDLLTEFDGTLAITGGSISTGPNGPQITGNVAGTISRSADDAYQVSGAITGGFFGDTGQYLNGIDDVTVTNDGTPYAMELSLNAARRP